MFSFVRARSLSRSASLHAALCRNNKPSHLYSDEMWSHSIKISDAVAEASRILANARLDGLDQVSVPFAERYVHAWQRGAPEHDMDVYTLIGVIKVRFTVLYKLVSRPLQMGGLWPAIAAALSGALHAECSPRMHLMGTSSTLSLECRLALCVVPPSTSWPLPSCMCLVQELTALIEPGCVIPTGLESCGVSVISAQAQTSPVV